MLRGRAASAARWDLRMAILLELFFAGSVVGFCIWQVVSVRRELRRDAERAARERAQEPERTPPEDG